jgi:hypothetical protein
MWQEAASAQRVRFIAVDRPGVGLSTYHSKSEWPHGRLLQMHFACSICSTSPFCPTSPMHHQHYGLKPPPAGWQQVWHLHR